MFHLNIVLEIRGRSNFDVATVAEAVVRAGRRRVDILVAPHETRERI